MRDLGLVMVGGALGSGLRHLVAVAVRTPGFPWATLGVNLVGSLVLGIVWSLVDRGSLPPAAKVALGTGVLGGFTTYSTFSAEWARLLSGGQWPSAVAYGVATVGGGLACSFAGFWLGRSLP
jgi:CrcB protein